MMELVGTPNPEMSDEVPLTREQVVAEFEAATPGEVVRTPRSIMVIYRYEGGRWHASSPRLRGFEIHGNSLDETQRAVRADLSDYLDPAVRLDERVWHPWQVTTQVGGQILATGMPLAVTVGANALIITTTQGSNIQGFTSVSVASSVTAGSNVTPGSAALYYPAPEVSPAILFPLLPQATFKAWPQSRADVRTLVVMGNTPTTVGQAA